VPINKPQGKLLQNELRFIIQKYLYGKATEKEKAFLNRYYHYFDSNQNVTATLTDEQKETLRSDMRQKISEQIKHRRSILYIINKNSKRIAVAAALVALIFSSVYVYINQSGQERVQVADIQPGSNKAVLQLADGSKILLDSAGSNQHLASQDQVNISLKNGHLAYDGASDKMLYNTMSTPRGGYYQLTLSDGTRVWLNARSSLNYPVAFKGGERKVSLAGEAYFEVAKNAKPFKVALANKGMIEVLGTHFNVMAYPEQAVVKATLLEGKVKVSTMENSQLRTDKTRLLSPGQQAVLGAGGITVDTDVDVDAAMSWKNGKFYFENATLETILNEFSLWYDIDIIYQGKGSVKNKRFFMIMNRNVPLSEALKSLKTNDILFNIEGRKLIVK